MANWPPVDPADLSEASSEDLLNRATGFTYEPGSTFKAFTVAAALEEKEVTPETPFGLPSTLQVADRTIEESHARGPVTMTVSEILAYSSNVGAATIGLQMGAEKFSRWIDRFGFGRTTGVEFPGEEQGLVLPLDEYSGSTMGNLPIGQGLSVTPMQMVAGYTAIANGGMLKRPQLIQKVDGEPVEAPKGRRVIDAEVASQVRTMLEGVLGAGRHRLGGQRPRLHPGRQDGNRRGRRKRDLLGDQIRRLLHRLRPRPEPAPAGRGDRRPAAGSDYYGGSVAAPAFGSIAGFALPYLGVPAE